MFGAFRILETTKASFYSWTNIRLLGLYEVVKGILLSFLVVFGCLDTSRGVSLVSIMIASVSDIKCFRSSNAFFQFYEDFFGIFIYNNDTYSTFKRGRYKKF